MQTDINRLTVAIRELGEGGVWRWGAPDCPPHVRHQPQPPAQRAELARQLVDAFKEILGLREDNLNATFAQHSGDEMYHTMYEGPSGEWVEGKTDKLGEP